MAADNLIVLSLVRAFVEANCQGLEGRFLDLGCGRMPYRAAIEKGSPAISEYVGMDIANPLYPKPPHAWDGANIPLASDSVNAVLLTEVLEHCPDPGRVLAEVFRVLKPGGRLVLTVPFLWPLHDVPGDYVRFTPFGMRLLLERNGFQVLKLVGLGGWPQATAQLLELFLARHLVRPWHRWILRLYLQPLLWCLRQKNEWQTSFTESSLLIDLGAVGSKPPAAQ